MDSKNDYSGYVCFYSFIDFMLRTREKIVADPGFGRFIRKNNERLVAEHPDRRHELSITATCTSPKGKFNDSLFLAILTESAGLIDDILEERKGA